MTVVNGSREEEIDAFRCRRSRVGVEADDEVRGAREPRKTAEETEYAKFRDSLAPRAERKHDSYPVTAHDGEVVRGRGVEQHPARVRAQGGERRSWRAVAEGGSSE